MSDSNASAIATWLLRANSSFSIRHVSRPSSVLGTARGRVRSDNQDIAVVAVYTDSSSAASFRACVVCDGLGGMEQGAQCAAEATAQFLTHLVTTAYITDRNRRLRDAIEQANREVFHRFKERGGTTLAAVLWTASGVNAVCVGDTRIYRQAEGESLSQLTVDDTIASRIAELKGKSAGQFAGGPFAHHLAQFIGQRGAVTPQTLDAKALLGESATDVPSRSGLLITTDGIHRMGNEILQSIARHAASARELTQRLISLSDWMGGADNATALYISLQESSAAPAASRQPVGLTVHDAHGEMLLMPALTVVSRRQEAPAPAPVTTKMEKPKPDGRRGAAKAKRKPKRKQPKQDPRQAELIRVTEHSE